MFEITTPRKSAFDMHPPLIVYILLFALSCGCALFAGNNMTDPHRNLLHIIAFAAVFSLTIYSHCRDRMSSEGPDPPLEH
jgi:hypothetical protein